MANPRASTIQILPPLGGVVRRTGFQTQPPFTSYDAVNFWPFDAKTGRAVLATRPPLEQLTTPAGTGSGVVYGATPVDGKAAGKPSQSMLLNVDGTAYYYNSSGGWTAATGAQAAALSVGRAVYGAAMLEKVFIANSTTKPLVFDYDAGTVTTLVEAAGTAPSDCRIVFEWQGCLNLMGALDNPQVWYQSREGAPLDYDYGASSDDLARAWATTLTDDSGKLTGPITAGMPQTGDYVVVSCLGGMIALLGRRPRGGIFYTISRSLYVLGQGAWTKTPDGTLYFMTQAGLYKLPPQEGAVPIAVSETVLPSALKGIPYTYGDSNVQLAYSTRYNGIYITVRGDAEQQWFFDLALGGFHPMETALSPFVLQEFAPLISPTTCGVLWGGYDGLSQFDAFGDDETFEASVIAGPIAITPDPLSKGMLTELRFVFGQDTPASDLSGKLVIAVGADGQDAVNRLLLGDAQFSANLTDVAASDGRVYPRLAGQAFAAMISHATGYLVWEDAVSAALPKGRNRLHRSEQLPIDGTPFTAYAITSDFDPSLWEGYCEATPIAPCATLVDFTHWVDLSKLPESWWTHVHNDGGDIRATDANGVQLPVDIIDCDIANHTGFVCLKCTQTTTPIAIRLWVGNQFAETQAATATYGQYATYDDDTLAFWPDGATTDRTQYQNVLTPDAALPDGEETGPFGTPATDYNGLATNVESKNLAPAQLPTGQARTLVGVFQRETGTTSELGVAVMVGSALTKQTALYPGVHTGLARTRIVGDAATTDTINPWSEDGTLIAGWHHYTGRIDDLRNGASFVDGEYKDTKTASVDVTLEDETFYMVGRAGTPTITGTNLQGTLALAQVHDTARIDCWVRYQAGMLVQDTFWGDDGWGEFVSVNDPPSVGEPPEDVYDDACPTGEVAGSESGTWSGYAEATPNAPDADVPACSLFIDLSQLPANWWSAVSATGADIRATNKYNQFLPLDLIEFDQDAQTGFAVVQLNQFEVAQYPVRLWVGNVDAVDVDQCTAYGRFNAYDAHWRGFWPTGAGEDRTIYQNDFAMSSGITEGGEDGPAGNTATSYSGGSYYGEATHSVPDGTPLTLIAASLTESPSSIQTAVLLGLQASGSLCSVRLGEVAAYNCSRLYLHDVASSSKQSTANLHPQSADTWYHLAGVVQNEKIIALYVDGGEANTSAYQLGKYVPLRGLDTIRVGAMSPFAGSVTQVFGGHLCLVSLHDTVRSEEWIAYQADMLDQATFWGAGWAWTAESSSLPQV